MKFKSDDILYLSFTVLRCIHVDIYWTLSREVYHDFLMGPDRRPIWLVDVDCQGYESDISQCKSKGWGITYCGHLEDASVRCSEYNIRKFLYYNLTLIHRLRRNFEIVLIFYLKSKHAFSKAHDKSNTFIHCIQHQIFTFNIYFYFKCVK